MPSYRLVRAVSPWLWVKSATAHMASAFLGASRVRRGIGSGFPSLKQHVEGHEANPHHQGCIGDVERRPFVRSDVPDDEVSYAAERDAVDEVTDGAAADQAEGQVQPVLPRSRALEVVTHQ